MLRSTWGGFTNRMFLSVTASEGFKNVIIAPRVIQQSLAMLYLGSEGESNRELKKTLELKGTSISEAMEEFKNVPLIINTPEVMLQTAYKFYVDSMFPIRSGYLRDIMTYLQTKPESVKFSNGSELNKQISLYIGSLVQRRQVEKVITVEDISSKTRSVLLQGFFFEGNFSRPFQKMAKRRKFFTHSTNFIPAYTFRKIDSLPYADLPQLSCQGIMIPYKNSNLRMLVMLPKKSSNLKNLETQLANTEIRTISKFFRNTMVQIEIPEFQIDYNLDLIPALRRMGIKAMFDYPEFNTLTDTPFFSVTKIKHSGTFRFTCGEVVCQPIDNNARGI